MSDARDARKAGEEALLRPRPASRPADGGWRLRVGLAVALGLSLWGGWRYVWPHPAESWQVTLGDLEVYLRGPGLLDANRRAEIGSRVQGALVDLRVERNDSVGEGDLLGQVIADDLAGALAAALASAEAATQAIHQADSELAAAEAVALNAHDEYQRQAALLPSAATAQTTHDAALATHRQARAGVLAAEAALGASIATRHAALAEAERQRAQLAQATLRAPFSGVVVSRSVSLGTLVGPGMVLMELVDPLSVVLVARFDESAIARVQPGQPVRLDFASGQRIPGRVLRVGRQVDAETREFNVEISPDWLPTQWALGQRGEAEVQVGRLPGVPLVPIGFIARRGERDGLWVLDDGRARWREARFGARGDALVEVREGVAPGEVVLSGSGLYGGMRVRTRSERR